MINELYDTKEQAFEAGKMVGRLGLDDWAKKRIAELEAALAWYGEHARLCRLIHSEGDAGRHALAADGGQRAKSVLTKLD